MNIKNKPWKPGKYNLGLWHAPHNIQFSGGGSRKKDQKHKSTNKLSTAQVTGTTKEGLEVEELAVDSAWKKSHKMSLKKFVDGSLMLNWALNLGLNKRTTVFLTHILTNQFNQEAALALATGSASATAFAFAARCSAARLAS